MGYEVFYLVNFYLCTPEYTLSRYFFHSTCYLVFTISLKNPKLSHFTNPFKSKILKLYLFLIWILKPIMIFDCAIPLIFGCKKETFFGNFQIMCNNILLLGHEPWSCISSLAVMTRIKTFFLLVLWVVVIGCHCFIWNSYKPDDHKTEFQTQLIHRLKSKLLYYHQWKKSYIFLYFRFP